MHTLNGTAVTARAMIAILENFQDADGSIVVPASLTEFGAPARLGAERLRRALQCLASLRLVKSCGVPERSNGAVLKTADGATRPWVQIPPPPP